VSRARTLALEPLDGARAVLAEEPLELRPRRRVDGRTDSRSIVSMARLERLLRVGGGAPMVAASIAPVRALQRRATASASSGGCAAIVGSDIASLLSRGSLR
jgi:hypothetical protein